MSGQRVPAFEHVVVSVTPISFVGNPPHGLTVGIMNEHLGHGTRSSIEFAEAEAKTVLKAIRAYRRAHPELLAPRTAERPEGENR